MARRGGRKLSNEIFDRPRKFGIGSDAIDERGGLGGDLSGGRVFDNLQDIHQQRDFGFAQANTTYGVIGVKCWVYQGERIPERGLKKLVPQAVAV